MLYCWRCNSEVVLIQFDWICSKCGQHGEFTSIAIDWEKGRYWNAPYISPDKEIVKESIEATKDDHDTTINEILEENKNEVFYIEE